MKEIIVHWVREGEQQQISYGDYEEGAKNFINWVLGPMIDDGIVTDVHIEKKA